MTYILVIEKAPRSGKLTYYIAKQRAENSLIYDTWAKCDYADEALARVEELNKSLEERGDRGTL